MVETIDAGAHRYVGAAFTVVDSGAIRVHRERCAKVRNRNVDCLKCAAACTSGCISLEDGELVIDASKCVGCGTCATVCPTAALEARKPDDKDLLRAAAATLQANDGVAVIAEEAMLAAAAGKYDPAKVAAVKSLGRVDESLIAVLVAGGASSLSLIHI